MSTKKASLKQDSALAAADTLAPELEPAPTAISMLQSLQDAVIAAEANLIEKQVICDGYAKKEAEMISKNERLHARNNEIAAILKKYEGDMTDAIGNDTKRPTLDAGGLRAEAVAITASIAGFPSQLADHRMRSGPSSSGLFSARGALGSAKFNLAVHQYRLAMKDIWQFADAVRQGVSGTNMRIDLDGLADSASRFGRLPSDAS